MLSRMSYFAQLRCQVQSGPYVILSSKQSYGSGESHCWIYSQRGGTANFQYPSAMAVDALSMNRKAIWAYAYPLPALLPQFLEKVQRDWCQLILIAPRGPHAIWFTLLLGVLVDSPLQIPNIHRLLSQPRGLIHQDPSNIQLHTWTISGTHSPAEAFRSTLAHTLLYLSESLLWQSTTPSGRYSLLGASHNRLIHSRLLRV